MKKQIMTLVVVLTLLAMPKATFAQSYIYLGQNPAAQKTAVPGPENYVVDPWASPPTQAISWKADPAIRSYVVAAIGNWQAVMPSQTWIEVSAYPRVEFYNNNSACPTALACISIPGWVGVWTSNTPVQNWNWIWSVGVYSSFNNTHTNNAKIGQIAHEIGHIFGLADRYAPPNCGTDNSIMDAMYFNISTNVTTHCDNLTGPSTLDDQRTSSYYEAGEFDTFQSALVGSTLKYTWYDLAWADKFQNQYFYYLNGSTWIQYAGPISTSVDVGIHKQIEARQLIMQINPSNYGTPHGRYYRACGWSLFPGWYGTWKCSNSTFWP